MFIQRTTHMLWFLSISAALAAGQTATITKGGVVNAADYSQDLAPGSLISIFGSNLASETTRATSLPLPTFLGGSTVEIVDDGNNVQALPLWYVSASQINAQLPYGLLPGRLQVRLRSGAATSNSEIVTIVPRAPKLFTADQTGQGRAIATSTDYKVLTDTSPGKPADTIILYLGSAGEVSGYPIAGRAAPGLDGTEPARITESVTAAINGVTGTVQFAGLTPGSTGLYQVNVLLPQVVLTGPANVEVRIGDVRTQAKVNIPFRQLGFYFALLGGKPVPGQTLNAAGGTNSSLAFRHSDLVAWGPEGYNAWTKNNGLNSTFSGSSGLALTLRSGNTVVFDNNGIEDRSFGGFYDNTNGGDNALKPGLSNLFSMSNYFNLVFATYVKLTQRTTVTEIDVYFDGDGNADLPFDPYNPYFKYRLNIWSSTSGPAPIDTKNFVGNVLSTDSTAGQFTIADTGAVRIFNDPRVRDRNVPDPIFRLSFKPASPISLEAGEYWFSSDASVRPQPASASTASAPTISLAEFQVRNSDAQAQGRKASVAASAQSSDDRQPLTVRPNAPVSFEQ